MVVETRVPLTNKAIEGKLYSIIEDEECPEEYKEWAKAALDNISIDELDKNKYLIASKIFGYYQGYPTPENVRDLVESLLLDEIYDGKNGDAANDLGALYYDGQIGEQSYETALEYYKIGAEYGSIFATENLGYCYYYGRSVEKDYDKAFECFSLSALLGSPISTYKIGDMYKNGYHVEKNEIIAFKAYDQAYNLMNNDKDKYGDCDADIFVRLSECALKGIGLDKDPYLALSLAQRAELGFRNRIKNRDYKYQSSLKWALELQEKARDMIQDLTPIIDSLVN